MPVSMVALKSMTYAGQPYATGDALRVRDGDALMLRVTQLAADAPPSLDADQSPLDDAGSAETPKASRRYRRKDMVAES